MKRPDIAGPAAEAWKAHTGGLPRILSAWLIHAPGQSPAWNWYFAAVLDLSDHSDYPEAYRLFPEADWEFTVCALHPESKPTPYRPKWWEPLSPSNLRVQVPATRPKYLELTLKALVLAICQGTFPAEPMFPWFDGTGPEAQELRGTILANLKHFVTYGLEIS
jgi:hypothetical protein